MLNQTRCGVDACVLLLQSQALKCVQKVLLSKDKVRLGL